MSREGQPHERDPGDPPTVGPAAAEPPLGRPTPEQIEEALLGGSRRHTRQQVGELAGVSLDYAQRIWRALGFARVPDGVVAFTDGDLAALRRVADVFRSGMIDEELGLRLARAMGQTMARLAEWQIDAVVDSVSAPDEPPADEAVRRAVEVAERFAPDFEELLLQVWRRQLAAAGSRVLASTDTEVGPTRTRYAVGFVDLVGFTELTRKLSEDRLVGLVESFENVAADLVAELGGRVVKTLGDEVLFVTDTPGAGAEVGVGLAERFRVDEDAPDVRVGLAYGTVLLRAGDVFGTTVNLASRLTTFARPGSVLADEQLAAELAGTRAYRSVPIRRRSARGLGTVQPYVVRRARHTRDSG